MKFGLILSLIFFTACKLNTELAASKDIVSNVGDLKTQTDRKLTMSEKEILNRVCTQLKKKRELFETLDYLKEKIIFNRNNRDCSGGITGLGEFEVSLDNSAPRDMAWNFSGAGEYLKDIVTDGSNNLRLYCENVFRDINLEMKNTLITNNVKTTINIYIDSGYDKIEFVNSVKKKDEFKPTSGESIVFFTQTVQAPSKFMGMEKSRAKYTICENGRTAFLKQDLMRLTTKFERL